MREDEKKGGTIIWRVRKNKLGYERIPFIDFQFPDDLKRFTAFVGVIGVGVFREEKMHGGAGILYKPNKVITCHHLFEGFLSIEEIFVCFFKNERGQIYTLQVPIYTAQIAYDLAYLDVETYGNFQKPASLLSKPLVIGEKEKLVAVGCPLGLFAKAWRPQILGISGVYVVSQGFLAPGVSGGGLLVKRDKWYEVFAIHCFGFYDSKSLYSILVKKGGDEK